MAYKNKFKVDTIRTIAFGAIGAAYSAVGTALDDPARLFCLTNTTDVDLYFSIDGTNDHFIVPTDSFKLIDITTNRVREDGFFLAEGTIFYVKEVSGAAGSGSVYVEIIHA